MKKKKYPDYLGWSIIFLAVGFALFVFIFSLLSCDSGLILEHDGVIPNDVRFVSFDICWKDYKKHCSGCNQPGKEIYIETIKSKNKRDGCCGFVSKYCLIEEAPLKHPKLKNKEIIGRKYFIKGDKPIKVFFFYRIKNKNEA